MPVKESDRELFQITRASSTALEAAIRDLARAKITNTSPYEAQSKLNRLLAQTLALTSLLGRRRVLLLAKARIRQKTLKAVADRAGVAAFASGDYTSPIVPEVTFDQAIADLLGRYPTLAPGYMAVQEAYAHGHAFALAKSTNDVLTSKVQAIMGSAIAHGHSMDDTSALIASMGDWTRSYARTVYRTNATTAYTAGILQQSRDPDIVEVMPALEFIGRRVAPSRLNHIACVGLIAGSRDRLWAKYAPPLGYLCTHSLNLVDKWDLKERGLLQKDGTIRPFLPPGFAAGGPDVGFMTGGNLDARFGLAH